MKYCIPFIYSLLFLILINECTSYDNSKYFTKISKITLNHGFSSEMDTIASEKCYTPYSYTEHSNIKEITFLRHSLYHFELLSLLHINQDAFYYLSNASLYRYLRAIENDEFSISFSFIKMYSNDVSKKHSSDTFINQKGFSLLYSSTNKDFRLLCGDYLIDKFTIGALVIFTIKLEFESIKDKNDCTMFYNVNDYLSSQSIDKLIIKFHNKINQLNLKGLVKVYSIQLGGRDYLSKNVNENSFIINTCKFNVLVECQHNIDEISTHLYANFINQFAKGENGYYPTTYFVPLVIVSLGKSVDDYGIALNESNLANGIINNRKKTLDRFIQNWNLYKYFNHLDDFYYVPFEGIIKIKKRTLIVLNSILNEEKGLKCYVDIPNCEQETRNIFNYIPVNIDDEVLSFNKRFKNERLYLIEFKDDFCLRHGLEWEESSQKKVYLFQNDAYNDIVYLRDTNGFMDCKTIRIDQNHVITLLCYENLLLFHLKIFEKEGRHYLECRNEKELAIEYEINLITRHNDFSYEN